MTIAVTIKNAHVNGAGYPAGRSISAQVYDVASKGASLPDGGVLAGGEHLNAGPPAVLAPGEECTVYVHSTRGVDITEV